MSSELPEKKIVEGHGNEQLWAAMKTLGLRYILKTMCLRAHEDPEELCQGPRLELQYFKR